MPDTWFTVSPGINILLIVVIVKMGEAKRSTGRGFLPQLEFGPRACRKRSRAQLDEFARHPEVGCDLIDSRQATAILARAIDVIEHRPGWEENEQCEQIGFKMPVILADLRPVGGAEAAGLRL